jgi:hypothetical protein
MADSLHPEATHHLPAFITAPGDTDILMVVMWVILIAAVLGFGILFLRLHTLPERIAHRSHRLQFEIVAVLGLISLFTHMHIFWIIGLLLALVDLPDFGTPLRRIAGSVEKIAGIEPGEGDDQESHVTDASVRDAADVDEHSRAAKRPIAKGDGTSAVDEKPRVAPADKKEPLHA